ncbi:MAG: FecR domain-containing protein [Bacteroidetes bacterium]|nr:FecR domain-containing protein [Bacteroidota bacterium]
MVPQHIQAFLDKYDRSAHTAAEHSTFLEWLKTASPDELSFVVDSYGHIAETSNTLLPADPELAARIAMSTQPGAAKVIGLRRFLFRAVAAAIIIILLGFSAFYIFSRHPAATPQVAGLPPLYKNDLPPGSDKATLTLADGSTITLDSAASGKLAQQGNTSIIRSGSGQLSYSSVTGKPAGLLYNSLTTPRGGQYRLVLPDGSKVWLNAASSLRFPTSFGGGERRVELSGEAYFEVAPLARKNGSGKVPFIVHSQSGDEVEVLGTHFNVNGYNDEEAVKTTLLEGSVRLHSRDGHKAMLVPGQQGAIAAGNDIKVADAVNTEEVVAWTNNRFSFNSADIKTIMRQLARWYDVDVVYNKPVQGRFNAEMPRNTNASDVLRALELTGKVKFAIDGRKIIVMP